MSTRLSLRRRWRRRSRRVPRWKRRASTGSFSRRISPQGIMKLCQPPAREQTVAQIEIGGTTLSNLRLVRQSGTMVVTAVLLFKWPRQQRRQGTNLSPLHKIWRHFAIFIFCPIGARQILGNSYYIQPRTLIWCIAHIYNVYIKLMTYFDANENEVLVERERETCK